MTAHRPDQDENAPWPFVRNLIRLEVADSTNDIAKQLAFEDHDDLPLAVWAARQTGGRGRGENAWWSDAGSLTFSVLLDPQAHGLKIEHEPRLALVAAVAVIDTLLIACELCGEVRWPNDIEFEGRKLGGILPERVETPRGTRLVIGIGLNVSTRLDNAPADVRRMAVSLMELMPDTGPAPDQSTILRGVLATFGANINRLAHNDDGLATAWASFDSLLNRPVRVDLGTRVVSGLGRGVDADGALLVETEGEVLRLFGGRVLRS